MKAEVMWMGGDRIDGYYYVGIEGTDLVACEDGHPDFVDRFNEFSKDPKKEAQKYANRVNKQLKKLEK